MNQIVRHLAVILVSLVLFSTAQAGSALCWESQYNCDVMPASTGWTAAGGYETTWTSVSNGVLTLAPPATKYGWWEISTALDFTNGSTIEWRAKINSVTKNDNFSAASLRFYDFNGNFADLGYGNDGTNNYIWSNSPGSGINFNFTAWHTYRVTILNNIVNWYIDNNPSPVYSGTALNWSQYGINCIQVGDYTGSSTGANWNIDYIWWTNRGAFAPGTAGITGDYDLNCQVDFRDLAILAQHWLTPDSNHLYDLTGDGIVNFADLKVFLANWLYQSGAVTYITDMSQCTPASAITAGAPQGDKWFAMPYETNIVSGNMVGAYSFINAPEITVPLNASGWYAVYIGYWKPDFPSDGTDTMMRVKFTGDPAFRQVYDDNSVDTQDATFLREAFLDYADLTGKDMVIAKSNGAVGKKAFVAYIKLVPLDPDQVMQIEQDRQQTATRNLLAVIDGRSYFGRSQYAASSDILEEVELYRNSDVARVLWGVSYGSSTNYPTSVSGAGWLGGSQQRTGRALTSGSNDYICGEKQMHDTLSALNSQGIMPEQLIASEVHAMGRKFDLMFYPGITGGIIGHPYYDPNSFVNANPGYRQMLANGTFIQKASYAFPQARQFMISLVQEAAQMFDVDGINLCFTCGPHFVQYEQPVLDAFQAAYGVDARLVSPTDSRLGTIRAQFMGQFIHDVRAALDQIGIQKGKNLELSVWVWPSTQSFGQGTTPLQEGLDVGYWIQQGWISSVICQNGIDTNYKSLCQTYNCKFVLYSNSMSPVSVSQAYINGVNNFAFWNVDSVQMYPESWAWIRHMGHSDEMSNWDFNSFKTKSLQLKTVNGVDVLEGLATTVYSGG